MMTLRRPAPTYFLWSFIAVVITLLLYSFHFSTNKIQVPEKLLGNWINSVDNTWEYGFFEDFAIYENAFWTYSKVSERRNKGVEITLENGDRAVKLHIDYTRENNSLRIKHNGGAEALFTLMDKVYPDYSMKDTLSYSAPNFAVDSATIIGYYRNLNKGVKGFVQRFFPSPFEVALADYVTGEELKYYADIDELGRFKITIPIMNAQELYIDWKRTRLKVVVEPGDTLLMFADIADYIPTHEDEKSYEAYIDRPKQVLFMGDNARLNNELRKYSSPWLSINRRELSDLSDMAYLDTCRAVYTKRMDHLKGFIDRNPNTSTKFIDYKRRDERYDFAFNLMQRRYDIQNRPDPWLPQEYMAYVESFFQLNDEFDYTLTRYFNAFLSDYIGYKTVSPGSTVMFSEIAARLKEDGRLTPDIDSQLGQIERLSQALNTAADNQQLKNEVDDMTRRLNSIDIIKETAEMLHSEKSFLDFSAADSLVKNENLAELWITNRYVHWFEVLHKPLSVQAQTIYRQKVKNPFFRSRIDNLQKQYGKLAKDGLSYFASLKNTEHLKEHKDAKRLFEHLIEPYKGKVVYIDFWGTWCGGCRRDLKLVGDVKEKLKGQDVIFMYFVNRSPESTWKNIIKEMHLTGENIVHYRLPDEQHGMIERYLGVTTFPTYVLVNKSGEIVDAKAVSPADKDGVLRDIQRLL